MYQFVIQMASPELSTHAIPLQTYYYFPIISFVRLLNGLTIKRIWEEHLSSTLLFQDYFRCVANKQSRSLYTDFGDPLDFSSSFSSRSALNFVEYFLSKKCSFHQHHQ